MKQDVKEKWLAALRGGHYKQGVYMLRSEDNKFCVLGVLSDVYKKECGGKWSKWMDDDGIECYFFADQTRFSKNMLIQSVRQWAGLTEGNPITKQGPIVALNDSYKYTFEELANIIETDL